MQSEGLNSAQSTDTLVTPRPAKKEPDGDATGSDDSFFETQPTVNVMTSQLRETNAYQMLVTSSTAGAISYIDSDEDDQIEQQLSVTAKKP